MSQTQTPLMRQYWDIKSAHQDKILLFRMGDFYEMFFDDAVKAAPLIGIALTSRNKKAKDETPLCGVPYHSVAGPINKLLQAGLKVAICDQIEDPKMAKGIVKRAVTRILTPGMVYDADTLDAFKPLYISSFDKNSVSFFDSTTGEAFYFLTSSIEEARKIYEILPVAEIVVTEEFKDEVSPNVLCTVFEDSQTTEWTQEAPASASRLVRYAMSLSHSQKIIKSFERRYWQHRLELSPTTIRHLEIFTTYKGETKGSLFQAINRCLTPMGARMFRQWLSFPLTDLKKIETRQDRVQSWFENPVELQNLRKTLSSIGDVERRLAKVSVSQAGPRELVTLADALEPCLDICKRFSQLAAENKIPVPHLDQLVDRIKTHIVEEPPLSSKQGHFIKQGVYPDLDELIVLSTQSQKLVQEMELREKEKSGISSLKIRYNNVFGYYIEITNTHKDKVPADYKRKQTLANAERFYTDDLIELEKKVLSAQTKRFELEFSIFEALRSEILDMSQDILLLACFIAELDSLSSLAWLALEYRYVRPQLRESGDLIIKGSRHPVVEQEVENPFIPNDIEIKNQGCMLLTGPNMAGKSTLMRQVAVTVIMAQMGSFIPASEGHLPTYDRIFTRIGASDSLSEGLSTFMVEMKEAAEVIALATPKSLVILDEIGRGTSTYDGLSLAQAILEYLLSNLKCMTLFATHYHELTKLESEFSRMFNAHMSVVEQRGEIKFLHTLKKGPATKSYGVHVALLAGIPQDIIKRSQNILRDLESQRSLVSTQLSLLDMIVEPLEQDEKPTPPQNSKHADLLEEIKGFSISNKTPLEALMKISQWQDTLKN